MKFPPGTLHYLFALHLLTGSILLPALHAGSELPAYKNTKLPTGVRVNDLMGLMTTGEKIGRLHCQFINNKLKLDEKKLPRDYRFETQSCNA